MAEKTKIAWCTHTFNPWLGCAKVNEACANCYAEELMDHRYHRVIWGPQGTRSRTKTWDDPPRWDRQAGAAGERRKVFCASLADVFEDRPELGPWRNDLFALIDRCRNLDFLLLTKRPENILRMWPGTPKLPRHNVWLGTSVGLQKHADVMIPRLLAAKYLARYVFLSCEPLLGPVDLSPWLFPEPLIDWVIVGGESDQGRPARPFDIAWARDLVRQCERAATACFVKQLGSAAESDRVPLALADRHGGAPAEWPADLRVRQCPESHDLEVVTM